MKAATRGEDRDPGKPIQRTVPASAWAPATVMPGPSSVFDVPKKARRKTSASTLPPLDVSKLKIEANVPVAPSQRGVKASRWRELLGSLKVGESVALPMQYRSAIASAAQQYVKRFGVGLVVRKMPTEVRVWRTS